MRKIEGQVAIVTGGTRGIGRAIAEALVDGGARVVVSARTAADVEATEEALERRAQSSAADSGGTARASGITADVRDHADCQRLVARTMATFGRLDILINNAGVGIFQSVEEMDAASWDTVIGTNLNGMFYCTHEAIPCLRASGGGWIINIGSLAGKNAFPRGAAYNASKFGLIGFSEALMQEVRHQGIRVSCIMPGSVATEFSSGDASAGASWKIAPEDVARIVMDLLAFPARTLPSRVEVRPSRPPERS